MKSFDPREFLQNEYDQRLSYSFWISAAIAQGEYDLAFQFLKKNADRKGILTMSNVNESKKVKRQKIYLYYIVIHIYYLRYQ